MLSPYVGKGKLFGPDQPARVVVMTTSANLEEKNDPSKETHAPLSSTQPLVKNEVGMTERSQDEESSMAFPTQATGKSLIFGGPAQPWLMPLHMGTNPNPLFREEEFGVNVPTTK